MAGIDKELDELYEECPILLDTGFRMKFPGVVDVAGFINAQKWQGIPRPLQRVGVSSMSEYLERLRDGDERAVQIYESTRDILGLK